LLLALIAAAQSAPLVSVAPVFSMLVIVSNQVTMFSVQVLACGAKAFESSSEFSVAGHQVKFGQAVGEPRAGDLD
jgi:hypothetical protein